MGIGAGHEGDKGGETAILNTLALFRLLFTEELIVLRSFFSKC